jgi:hypothetical protein
MNFQPPKIAAYLHIVASLFVIGIFGLLWYAAAGLASVFEGSFVPGLVAMFGKPIAIFAISFGVLEMTASIAVLRYKSWGRYTLLVVSVAQIWIFPIGTALSIFTFWALWNAEQDKVTAVM